jgi:hypothetical protein
VEATGYGVDWDCTFQLSFIYPSPNAPQLAAGSFILNKLKLLRGPLSQHRKHGTQDRESVAFVRSLSARMSPGTRRRLLPA